MNWIEFDYTMEDGTNIIVEGQGNVTFKNWNDHPYKTVEDIKFKCIQDDGTILPKSLLTQDDVTTIEDLISEHLTYNENDYDTSSDFYDRFET